MKSIPFRIRKRYFDQIVEGSKRIEYRQFSNYWLRRLTTIEDKIAVFVCGRRVHRRQILDATIVSTPSDFSEQGKKDVPTPLCFAILLGEAIE